MQIEFQHADQKGSEAPVGSVIFGSFKFIVKTNGLRKAFFGWVEAALHRCVVFPLAGYIPQGREWIVVVLAAGRLTLEGRGGKERIYLRGLSLLRGARKVDNKSQLFGPGYFWQYPPQRRKQGGNFRIGGLL
ncbi:hypothetical protein KP509_32G023100 [Ceratopteris richardii]|uniref:Uncharacterized protein n=1 Tax=Ceratopteris richardii TaxID=49495 RepID=A0A8T2QRJ6_CERRI|nr:hypothetical protein KP509_32G023100 [Ceratopteris richardii]